MVLKAPAGQQTFAVYGAIGDKYGELGGDRGPLGAARSEETAAAFGGRFNNFQNGFIYWHPETGAHGVWGLIGEKWNQLGREQFGYPITDEAAAQDGRGRYNHFRAVQLAGKPEASIYFTPETGAHAIYGTIRDKWMSMGAERSSLGYPTSDEYQDGPYRRMNFERGAIRWSENDGATVLSGVATGLAPQVRPGQDAGMSDQYMQMVGDVAHGNYLRLRCARGRVLVGLELRAGDLVDQATPLCATAKGPAAIQDVRTDGPGLGGEGGSPNSVVCPPTAPVVLKARFLEEGYNGLGLHNIYLYCGLAQDGAQSLPDQPSNQYVSPEATNYSLLAGNDPAPAADVTNTCPPGLVAVGIHGFNWSYVGAIGLICGPPVVGP